MEQNFEQNIPLPAIIIGFSILMVSTHLLRKKLRNRALIQQGQLPTEGGRKPSIEERIAANKSWNSGQIRSRGKGMMIVLWLLSLVWNLCFGSALVTSLSNPEIKTGGLIVLGILSILGIVPIYFAVRATIKQVRYGESYCCINGKAGVIGKVMSGTIRSSSDISATGDYRIELQCNESYETGSGKRRTTNIKSHWTGKQSVSHIGRKSSSGIPFSFSIPASVPETSYQISRGDINWQIWISAPTSGVDYSAMFVVPVFNMD